MKFFDVAILGLGVLDSKAAYRAALTQAFSLDGISV